MALPRLLQMPVPDSIKRQFCITCRHIASTLQQPDQRLALESAAFAELAQIATLRRFHAGQCSFEVMRRMPLAWLLKAHPFDLSGFLSELCFCMRGVGPIVEPHINYWRATQMVLLEARTRACDLADHTVRRGAARDQGTGHLLMAVRACNRGRVRASRLAARVLRCRECANPQMPGRARSRGRGLPGRQRAAAAAIRQRRLPPTRDDRAVASCGYAGLGAPPP